MLIAHLQTLAHKPAEMFQSFIKFHYRMCLGQEKRFHVPYTLKKINPPPPPLPSLPFFHPHITSPSPPTILLTQ